MKGTPCSGSGWGGPPAGFCGPDSAPLPDGPGHHQHPVGQEEAGGQEEETREEGGQEGQEGC